MKIVIVTGMSGAGKSSALNVLEDMGYYCMDNLPPPLMTNFMQLAANAKQPITKAAIGIDIRGGRFFESLQATLEVLRHAGAEVTLLFLEAGDEVLIRRYKELRRPHPMDKAGNIYDGIQRERVHLRDIRAASDAIIDTSHLTLGQLKEVLESYFQTEEGDRGLLVSVTSFGFKHGILLDADLVFDVRFLPNPYYDQALRPLTGLDAPVHDYVMREAAAEEFLRHVLDFLDFSLPLYRREGKSSLGIGVGCTGGKHRSVVLAQELGQRLRDQHHLVVVHHRDRYAWG